MNRWRTSILVLAFSLATAAAPGIATAAAASADAQLRTLYETDWSWSLRENGQIEDGEGGFARAGYLPRVDAATQDRRAAHWQDMLAALEQVPQSALTDEERVNAAVFRTNLEHALIEARFREWEMPFNSDSSFWTYLDARRPFRTA